MEETIRMPRLSDTMEEGTILKWLKDEGDYVKSGDVLLELETDKATMELDSSLNGQLKQIIVKQGAVQIGGAIGVIRVEEEKITEDKSSNTDNLGNLDSLNDEAIFDLVDHLKDGHKVVVSDARLRNQSFKSIIEELNTIIKSQASEIDGYLKMKEDYIKLKNDVDFLQNELKEKLGIKFQNSSLKDISLSIEKHFNEVTHFDSFMKDKVSKVEKWIELLEIDETEEVIIQVSKYAKEKKLKNILYEITQISNAWHSLKKRENRNIISHDNANLMKSKLSHSLIDLVRKIDPS